MEELSGVGNLRFLLNGGEGGGESESERDEDALLCNGFEDEAREYEPRNPHDLQKLKKSRSADSPQSL